MITSDRLLRMHLGSYLSNVSDGAHYALWWKLKPTADAFHNAIKDAVPQIVKLLDDNNDFVRSAAAKAFGKLAEQRKWRYYHALRD